MKYKIRNLVLVSSIMALGAIGSLAVHAESLDYNVSIQPSLAVTIPSNIVSLNLNPFTTPFNTANLPVTVSTNNPTGFTLTMSSTDTNLTLRSGSETIPTLATNADGYSESDFTTNAWGYKLSTATNYSPFALINQLLVTDAPTNASTSTVTFAAKADTSKPAGTYELAIDFTAVANYVPPADVPTTCNTPVPGITYMQEITSANKSTILGQLEAGSAYYLRDSRDNEPYCVSKLADGNLWLLDNLRLDLTDSNTMAALTASNTNATETSLTSLRSGNRSAGNQYANGAFVAEWDSEHTTNYYNRASVNVDSKDVTVTSYGAGSGKVGVYYNYCAASAGSYCYDSGVVPADTNATEDICPAGWRMPTDGSSGEYQALYTAYSSNATNFRNALSTPLSGRFSGGSANAQGSGGNFWSSTYYNGILMYLLSVSSFGVFPQSRSDRTYGLSVRCILGS